MCIRDRLERLRKISVANEAARVQGGVVGGNTNAPVIMMAEKAVDMIRQDHSLQGSTP